MSFALLVLPLSPQKVSYPHPLKLKLSRISEDPKGWAAATPRIVQVRRTNVVDERSNSRIVND